MREVAPADIVKFIESFNGQSTTGGEDHPAKSDALLHLLDRLPEDSFKSPALYAEMLTSYSRLQAYVECFKSNASVGRDMYTQWLSRDIHPVRDIWSLMKSLAETSSNTREAQPISREDEVAATMCAGILLEAEPKELLNTLVEASRKVARDQRQKFMVAKHFQGSILIHPGLPRQETIYYGDVEALANAGLLAMSYGSNGTPVFDVNSLGFRYYEYLKQQSGSPIQTVEAEIHRYIAAPQLALLHPVSIGKWRQAEQLLWSADVDAQFTTIGHLCREAIQDFAAETAQRLCIEVEQQSKAKTIATMRTVIVERRETLGKAHAEFLEALLSYWGAVSDLIQRQEHGSDKVGAPLRWEDARRVVFQTLLVMYEFSRSLS